MPQLQPPLAAGFGTSREAEDRRAHDGTMTTAAAAAAAAAVAALPNHTLAPLSPTHSNTSLTAPTVSETVMAEQISHNVVDNTESTSGSPLVDVAANQPTNSSATDGIHNDRPLPQTKNDSLRPSQSSDGHATDVNAISSSAPGPEALDAGADPSAGDALGKVPDIITTSHAQSVNGIGDALSGGEGPADEGSVDVSQNNSDTEGSRGDASEQKKDGMHHTRSSSVKKPTSFSKVSVTKNFLAKSASTTPTTSAKVGDKPSPVGTPVQSSALKPRLIAKTGASIRDVQKARTSAESTGGPDASRVWNKNRPVAPPPPKQFTDEELKQQYGIHLATRLQSDEDGKESKWADIDDDEDDWAPETVVWMDGTKSNLTGAQEAAPAPKEQKPASPQPPKPAESVKPSLAAKKPTELGPTKTILKPGASAAAAQAKQNASGTPTDGLLAQSKSPGGPAKSPWAALPPVEKVSPINPPVQQPQQPRFVSQDARSYEPAPPPQPAREIAADTFDRSWREGEGGTRELFNSANGRYEPVAEGRRGSIKPDSARKPSVLQRPSQNAPAEPSSAFQTRTASQSEGWGRRRGSSVSQGSMPPARRVSVSKAPGLSPAPERRSGTAVRPDMKSPETATNEPARPKFAQESAWQQQLPPRPESGPEVAVQEEAETETPVQAQERIMREKRETAKKRRQEEEQRLEAEKQERLKARLAQLEGAGKSRKEREAEAAAADKTPEITATAPKAEDIRAPHPAKPAESAAMTAPSLEAKTLPPAPQESRAEQPSPGEALPSPLPPKPLPSGLPDRSTSSADQIQRQPSRQRLSPKANARAPFQQQPSAPRAPTSSYSSPGDRKQQGFGRSPQTGTDTFTPWPTTAPNGNVWGTSGIGNGTFESANVFAPMPMSQQSSSLPLPPGMARPSPTARISPQSLAQESRSPSLQAQSVAEPQRGFAPPGFEPRTDAFANQPLANGASPTPAITRQPHAPGPIAPPSRSQQQQTNQQSDKLRAWEAAAENLPRKYQSDADKADRTIAPTPSVPREDTIKETFKRTAPQQGRLGGPRRYDQTEYTVHDAQGSRSVQSLSPAPPNAQSQPAGPFSTVSPLQQDPWKAAGEKTVRIPDGSLNAAHGGLLTQQPIGPPSARQPLASAPGNVNVPPNPLPPSTSTKEESPPPPDGSSHPVNSGDASHPLVKLPRGKPVVKLPPASLSSSPTQPPVPPQSSAMPQRPISNWGAPKPIAMQQAWQERFNGLFNRTSIHTEVPPSPPRTPPKAQGPSLAVASSSRTAMDDAPAASGATVSLPQKKRVTSAEGFTLDDSTDIRSKPTIEQMFDEELSFGSKPKVAVPMRSVYSEVIYQPAPLDMASGMNDDQLEARAIDEFDMLKFHEKKWVFVALPTLKLHKKLTKHHNTGGKQDRKASSRFNKPAKGKDSATASPSTNGTPNSGSRKPGAQKATTPAPGSPAPAAENTRKPSGHRGGGRRAHAQPQTVKPVQ